MVSLQHCVSLSLWEYGRVILLYVHRVKEFGLSGASRVNDTHPLGRIGGLGLEAHG